MRLMDRSQGYTPAEKISDATIHVLGLAMGVAGVAALIPLSVLWGGDDAVIAAATIYAVALLAMLGASASYHLSPEGLWKDRLRRIDHTAIYLKIAGTYTPFAVLSGMAPGLLLSLLWLSALIGGALRLLAPGRFYWLCLALYLGMGWSGVAVGADLFLGLAPATFTLILIGGLVYTLGVAVFLWESLPFHTTIWHAMVLLGSGFFYCALLVELSAPGAGALAKL